ncbi:hypothetical protein D3C73_785050 [compost metagenome]
MNMNLQSRHNLGNQRPCYFWHSLLVRRCYMGRWNRSKVRQINSNPIDRWMLCCIHICILYNKCDLFRTHMDGQYLLINLEGYSSLYPEHTCYYNHQHLQPYWNPCLHYRAVQKYLYRRILLFFHCIHVLGYSMYIYLVSNNNSQKSN